MQIQGPHGPAKGGTGKLPPAPEPAPAPARPPRAAGLKPHAKLPKVPRLPKPHRPAEGTKPPAGSTGRKPRSLDIPGGPGGPAAPGDLCINEPMQAGRPPSINNPVLG